MSIEDDTHDKLTKAYIEYFKANAKFERFKGERTMQESRKWLREIRNHAKQRADEIMTSFKNQKQDKKK